jgi:hypothetical protein
MKGDSAPPTLLPQRRSTGREAGVISDAVLVWQKVIHLQLEQAPDLK